MKVKQFKLTNNEEIVCEVKQWHDEETDEIIVKNALKVVGVEDYSRGIRYFALRPWMSFQDDPQCLHALNASHIIVTSTPNESMMKYYNTCLKEIKRSILHKTNKRVWANIDEVNEQTRDLTDDEFEMWLDSKYRSQAEPPQDSSENNVIKFKPKGTLH
tara:strand:- start:9 stop:485 length:477 start_codon:yes stop_codon:yes gene_type:complete